MAHTVNAEILCEDWYIENERDKYECDRFEHYRQMGSTPAMEDRYGPVIEVNLCDCGAIIPADAFECPTCAQAWSEAMSDTQELKYPGILM